MSAPLITWRWDGEGMVPEGPAARRKADESYVVGECYRMSAEDLRSWISHQHQFAWLNEAWLSLHDRYSIEPWAQSPDHLRKYALVRSGFAKVRIYACKYKAEARRLAATIEELDEFAIVSVDGRTVTKFTAESQSMQAMGGKRFQQSKAAVLEFIAGLLEVDPATLEQQGKAA